MDEILASIRRIIESGDDRNPVGSPASGRSDAKAAAATAPIVQADKAEPSEAPKSDPARADVHYLPSALGEQSPAPSEPLGETTVDIPPIAAAASMAPAVEAPDMAEGPSEPSRAVSLAVERAASVSPQTPAPEPVEATVTPKAGNENSSRPEEWPAAEPLKSPADFAFEFDDAQFEAALRGEEDGGEASPDKDVGSALQEIHAAAEETNAPSRPMPESVIDGASALLSAEAGDQVASAFNDLARAIREGHMRSMEEMAREMMRPMLQEWLDDNLPRIVERLVREEIERVARGARY